MTYLKVVNLALAFLLELCMLAAFGEWGFKTGQNGISRIGLGIGVPILVAVFWGIFLSPRATVQLSKAIQWILQVVLFGGAASALASSGHSGLAWLFASFVVLNKILLFVWGQSQ